MATTPNDQNTVLTRSAYERLKAEHLELTTDGRARVAERLLRARELGDLSENAEYEATKDEQGMLEARIRQLEHIIRGAKVVDGPIESDEVVPGMIVTVKDVAYPDDEPEVYLVAAMSEERAQGARTVSVKSPLGRALLGKRVGDKASYDAPGGTFTYEIVSLKSWDGRS